jgi:hypothetical protein
VHLGGSGQFKRRRENAAIPCGVRLSDGGHERSRTSDPYSIKVRKEHDQASLRTIEDEVATLKTMHLEKIGHHFGHLSNSSTPRAFSMVTIVMGGSSCRPIGPEIHNYPWLRNQGRPQRA